MFPHRSGTIERHKIKDYGTIKRCPLPEIPRARPNYAESVADNNKAVLAEKPWAEAMIDGIVLVDSIQRHRVRTRNRIALIVLDSLVEIGFKEFLLNETKIKYSNGNWREIVSSHERLVAEVRKHKELATQRQGSVATLG